MSIRVGYSGVLQKANCVRTGCHEDVGYNPRNPGLYCSTACRVAAARDQKWLFLEVERLESALADDADDRKRKETLDRLKIVQWHLRRYAPAWVDVPDVGSSDSEIA